MAKSQITFSKKEREKKKLQKRKLKEGKRAEKREKSTSGGLDDMIVYVNELGHFTNTPPEDVKKKPEAEQRKFSGGAPKIVKPKNLDK